MIKITYTKDKWMGHTVREGDGCWLRLNGELELYDKYSTKAEAESAVLIENRESALCPIIARIIIDSLETMLDELIDEIATAVVKEEFKNAK